MLMILTAMVGGILALRGKKWKFLPVMIIACTLAGLLDRPPSMEFSRVLLGDITKVFINALFIGGATFGICRFIWQFINIGLKKSPR